MESEPSGASGEARDEPILFISDASAEAERLTLALRSRGHVVADVPLALLAQRVAIQRPALVLCDADAESAVETVRRIRSIPAEEPVSIVVVGERDGTIATLDVTLVDAVFARPVNVPELVSTVERLIGVTPSIAPAPPSVRSTKMASSSRPPARSSPTAAPGPRGSDRVARADIPSTAAVPLPPDLAGDGPAPRESGGDAPLVELSGDIQLLLLAAERRLGEDRNSPPSGGEEPGPEADVEATLPPEVLVALEEPLDDEDESEKTGVPDRGDGTGGGTGSRTGSRSYSTNVGTASTSLGTDGTGPPSDAGPPVGGMPGPRTSVHPLDETPEPRSAGAPGDESRKARQQASTPKPPKPVVEDLRSTAPPDADRRSLPPPTAVEHAIPEPPSRKAFEAEMASMRMPSRGATIVEQRDLSSDRDGPRERAAAGIAEELDRADQTSTAPPLRGGRDGATELPQDERGTDRPGTAETEAPKNAPPRGRRESERPGGAAPVATRRESDRPSSPNPARRESDRPSSPNAVPPRAPAFTVPSALRQGDAVTALAGAIRTRFTGAIAFEVDEGIRRLVLRDGDFVTAVSGAHSESLVAFLANRGDLPQDVARGAHKLPAFGRRAGAALIAHGHLPQDQLWPVLRAHAEWIIGKVAGIERGSASIEDLGRLHDEPAVFGGATGAEVLVEVVRRILRPEDALERLGGQDAVLSAGPSRALLAECALSPMETEHIQHATGTTVSATIAGSPDPSLPSALYALVALGVLGTEGIRAKPVREEPRAIVHDELDDEAVRAKILARKSLVDEGDYFAVLGVAREATGYDIRRAYTTLRREFEPSRVLNTKSADLGDVVDEIIHVLDEAYEILSDQRRRDRYRRAIEATP